MFPNERFITARPCCLSQKQKAALETLFILFSYTNEKWRGIQVVPRAWNKQNSCYLTFMAALIAPLTTGVGSYKRRDRKLQFITVFSLVKTQSCLFEIKNSSYLFRDLASSSLYFVSILSILSRHPLPFSVTVFSVEKSWLSDSAILSHSQGFSGLSLATSVARAISWNMLGHLKAMVYFAGV